MGEVHPRPEGHRDLGLLHRDGGDLDHQLRERESGNPDEVLRRRGIGDVLLGDPATVARLFRSSAYAGAASMTCGKMASACGSSCRSIASMPCLPRSESIYGSPERCHNSHSAAARAARTRSSPRSAAKASGSVTGLVTCLSAPSRPRRATRERVPGHESDAGLPLAVRRRSSPRSGRSAQTSPCRGQTVECGAAWPRVASGRSRRPARGRARRCRCSCRRRRRRRRDEGFESGRGVAERATGAVDEALQLLLTRRRCPPRPA